MMFLGFSLAFVGFIALSLAMSRHFSQMRLWRKKRSKQEVLALQVMGYLCLLIAGAICMMNQGIAVGLVFWLGIATVAALLQSLLLTYRPKQAIIIGLATLALGVLLA